MLSRLRPRLTFANVMSCVALFVALGGTSYAALTIGSGQIKNHSIQGVDVAQNSITGENIKQRSLKEGDIGSGQVDARIIKNGAIEEQKIALGAVGSGAIKDHSIEAQKVALGSLTADLIKKQSLTADLFAAGQIPPGPPGQQGAVGPTVGVASTTNNTQGVLNPNAPSATNTIDLPTKSKLLIQGVDNYTANCGAGETGPAAIGLFLDGAFVPGSRRDLTLRQSTESAGTLVTMGLVSNVAAGTHTVSVASTPGCTGSSGFNGMVTAIALGG
jgi:hypothetical protein